MAPQFWSMYFFTINYSFIYFQDIHRQQYFKVKAQKAVKSKSEALKRNFKKNSVVPI